MKSIYIKQNLDLVSDETYNKFLSEHFPPDDHVLIIGCGAGTQSKQYPNSVNIDIDPDCAKFCKAGGVENCIVCSASHLPFKAKTFDKFMFIDVIEHFPNTPYLYRVVTELERVGTPNSLVAVVMPLKDSLLAFRKVYHKLRGWGVPMMATPGHTLAITKDYLLHHVFRRFVCIVDGSTPRVFHHIKIPGFISGGKAVMIFQSKRSL